ncbi:DNA mismatch repair endonuclease MutL [Eubacteriales bacterium OttesenSCG-928-M02]|nr:DNA mismatch repair endonuclease MutL [Eubacteriales bacterium OttesenSCG-928-M02]
MNRIELLDEKTSNRIAAGEVVTRPSAVIKELVENAIDAGATAVTVEIENGGMKRIYVSDNGSGIHPKDMALAFLRHATGKTRAGDDVFGTENLGFRGEALSSIAAVAKVRMTSRMAEMPQGMEIILQGGKVEEEREIGCPEGTSIYVDDLFYNTPARQKHIKSIGAETASCTDVISRLILAYPEISIRYWSNGSPIYHSPGSGLKDAIRAVYGQEIYDNILPVKYEGGPFCIEGYIGNASISRKTRAFQTMVINGRVIRSQRLSNTVSKAYSERIMIGRFPFYVLHITTQPERVDANVHPQKLELKLLDEDQLIVELIAAIGKTLEQNEKFRPMMLDGMADVPSPNEEAISAVTEPELEQYRRLADSFTGSLPQERGRAQAVRESGAAIIHEGMRYFLEEEAEILVSTMEKEDPPVAEAEPSLIVEEQVDLTAMVDVVDYAVIGQVFLTYLLVQRGEELIIVDQHAAHERLNYDRYLDAVNHGTVAVQQLLIPQTMELSPTDVETLMDNMEMIEVLGIEVERFGPSSMLVRGIPQWLVDVSPVDLMEVVVTELRERGKVETADPLKEGIIRASCRMSIKAGQRLEEGEIRAIMNMLKTVEKLTCPHGRPVAITLTKRELEKSFNRIQ